MNTLRKNWKSPLLLLLTATIWGVAFVAQSVGMDYVQPFTFNGVRCLLGAVVLLPVIYIFNRNKDQSQKTLENKKVLWTGGVICGLLLCAASCIQQIGILHTTAGKAGFLTALYIVIVPIIGLLWGRKCSPLVGVSIVLAIIGLYLLSIKDSFEMCTGDAYVMISAVLFAFHILAVDYYAPKCDGVKLSCIQFGVSGILGTCFAFIVEQPQLEEIMAAWQPIAYAGVLSCGVGYTLQIVGQRDMNPTVASLILSLESVISVLAGWVLLQQTLSVREMVGCLIMFCAIVLAQLPWKKYNINASGC